MSDPGPASASPRIRIVQGKDNVAIRQHRPSVLDSLTGLTVDHALALVPKLLPICGTAQTVAASRALEAARGESPSDAREAGREKKLWWEQAMSAGWRLAVDWPDLLGRPRALTWLKVLRHSANAQECASVLASALPGLDSVWSTDDLARWAQVEDNHAAHIIRAGLEHNYTVGRAGKRLAGKALAEAARESLGAEDFDPLHPTAESIEVGPLAMGRDPLIEGHAGDLAATMAGRLQALVLDTRQIIKGLQDKPDATDNKQRAWQESARTGTGQATTARGPVFHQVSLDAQDRVIDWRAVAPTDWHFAPGGPAARALGANSADRGARLAIAGFDPCAPWTLEKEEV
jgi:hypothetical protein